MTRPLRSARVTGPHRYYETVRPRAPRRYSTPHGVDRLRNSLSPPAQQAGDSVGATGSHVPCKSPGQARAAYMPDAVWAVGRLPPDLSRSPGHAPVSTPLKFLTTRHQRFAHARLPDPHLTRSSPRLFPQRSPRTALNRRSLRWFEASPCRATPEDLPPSLTQHRIRWLYISASFSVRGTRPAQTRRSPRAGPQMVHKLPATSPLGTRLPARSLRGSSSSRTDQWPVPARARGARRSPRPRSGLPGRRGRDGSAARPTAGIHVRQCSGLVSGTVTLPCARYGRCRSHAGRPPGLIGVHVHRAYWDPPSTRPPRRDSRPRARSQSVGVSGSTVVTPGPLTGSFRVGRSRHKSD
jgi:hypothetical protein